MKVNNLVDIGKIKYYNYLFTIVNLFELYVLIKDLCTLLSALMMRASNCSLLKDWQKHQGVFPMSTIRGGQFINRKGFIFNCAKDKHYR